MTLAIAVLSGGCAATDTGPSKVAGPISGYPGDPAPRPVVSQTTRVEIEADGLPAQLAPKHRRPVADEPMEPWSPNYGSVRSDASDPAPTEAKIVMARSIAPVSTHSVTPRLDPDDIIRIAIAEHEMRQH
jgi:hypothetical protein